MLLATAARETATLAATTPAAAYPIAPSPQVSLVKNCIHAIMVYGDLEDVTHDAYTL